LYATAVGLVMNSIRNNTKSATPFVEMKKEESVIAAPEIVPTAVPVIETETQAPTTQAPIQETTDDKIKRSFFDKYIDKIKDFLDNAE
jgi:cell division protein FtsA